ncbi:MAG: endonuclease III, partial [Kiritimatiellia bacterium]|nr:endonuclease III [Kiritimatiellia bacterium]
MRSKEKIPGGPSRKERGRAALVLKRLRIRYPDFRCELNYSTPLELAVAAILSAQCTDKRVNLVTPALFRKYRSAADWAETPQSVLEAEIRSTGFFRNKARNIRLLMRRLAEEFDGSLPDDFDTLVSLPGIGRKTANLLMATAFGRPGMIVDTHCRRVSQRLEFTRNEDPVKIEMDLRALIPEPDWTDWSHAMVFHGRYGCFARKPECDQCPVADLCPSKASPSKPLKAARRASRARIV